MLATNALETTILNALRNITSPVITPYLALFLSDPTDSGINGTEISYTGYTRLPITFSAAYAESGGRGITLAAELEFPTPETDAGRVTHIAIMAGATSSQMLLYAPLTSPLDVVAGTAPNIAPNDITYYALGNFTAYFKDLILDYVAGRAALQGVTTHFAPFNGDPENGGTELSGGSYARIPITFTAPVTETGGQTSIANSNIIVTPRPTSSWGTYNYDCLMDSLTGGKALTKAPAKRPTTILSNIRIRIDTGLLKVAAN
jgi:hypothetical protein